MPSHMWPEDFISFWEKERRPKGAFFLLKKKQPLFGPYVVFCLF